MTLISRVALLAGLAVTFGSGIARADPPTDPAAVKQQDGMWVDKDGNPTYKIDGKQVDYYTFAGYIRYSANCLQCHGPDALGSTYAPNLTDALKTIDFNEFYGIVSGGKQNVSSSQNLVMPALGENKNVMCYINAIYVYLRARSTDAMGRGRPEDYAKKPPEFTTAENSCMG